MYLMGAHAKYCYFLYKSKMRKGTRCIKSKVQEILLFCDNRIIGGKQEEFRLAESISKIIMKVLVNNSQPKTIFNSEKIEKTAKL